MLRRLTIEDYGLIRRAQIDFARGATMFTGETGSGKTMVLGAMTFVLGERANAEVVRRGASRATVTLEFEPSAALRVRLAADGFALDDGEDGVLTREMTDAGKSALRLNGRATTAGYVRDLAPELADIVGQHDAQRLLAPAYHVNLLDRFAGEPALRAGAEVADAFSSLESLREELRALSQDERDAADRLAYAQFGLEEIENIAPQDGEDERLTERRRYLDNVERIAGALRAAHDALNGDDSSAGDALGTAAGALAGVAEIGSGLAEMAGAAAALQSEAAELATQIARELDTVESDPAELEQINARLEDLDGLKRKYGGSLAAVAAAVEEFRTTVARFANRDELRATITARIARAQSDLASAAKTLGDLRRIAAKRLRERIERELADLALPSARFDTAFEPLAQIGPGGGDHVEFVFAANKGEPQRPLARVASGGELSRVLLALVVALASSRDGTALIFDEIDTGIGGATATAVGLRLGRLAGAGQVLCVTHLAQIASWADEHYLLEKREGKAGTSIAVELIDGAEDRTRELARMLSGEAHDVAVAHARSLLDQTAKRRVALASSASP
ncbi:MAG: DNA repair protein RecN [Candidatus Eremiobacterales bacterium]